MNVSVIIVKYHSDNYLDQCLESVRKEKPCEIIVVDNDKENRGYGSGCNLGAKRATGEILFFINPDTKLVSGCLKKISDYFKLLDNVGIIGPKLYTNDSLQTVQLSCCRKSGLITSLVVYGKIQRWFKDNSWWNYFTYKKHLILNKPTQVDIVSGAALAIRRNVFDKINGFDSKLFLYFEENDLCLRVKEYGYQNIYLPSAKVIHYGGGSMGGQKSIENIFTKSRKYYFTKHYPRFQANLLNILLK